MAVTHEDITELKKVFDDRYVQISDCDNVQQKFNSKFANDDKRIELLSAKLDTWNKLFWVIATSGIGTLVTNILSLLS